MSLLLLYSLITQQVIKSIYDHMYNYKMFSKRWNERIEKFGINFN
jgi:lysine/ornithine N-monooxygenase